MAKRMDYTKVGRSLRLIFEQIIHPVKVMESPEYLTLHPLSKFILNGFFALYYTLLIYVPVAEYQDVPFLLAIIFFVTVVVYAILSLSYYVLGSILNVAATVVNNELYETQKFKQLRFPLMPLYFLFNSFYIILVNVWRHNAIVQGVFSCIFLVYLALALEHAAKFSRAQAIVASLLFGAASFVLVFGLEILFNQIALPTV